MDQYGSKARGTAPARAARALLAALPIVGAVGLWQGARAQSIGRSPAPHNAASKHAVEADTGKNAPATAESSRRAAVLARYAGGTVTVAALEDAIASRPAHVHPQYRQAAGRAALLRELVDYALLVKEAERRGYSDDGVVRAETVRAQAELLKQTALAPDPAAVPEAALKAAVAEAQAERRRPAVRRVRLLVVPTRARAAALRREVSEARRRSEAAGMQALTRVIRAHSVHPSRKSGGVLPAFTPEGKRWPTEPKPGVSKAVADAAFATDLGRLSKVFAVGDQFAVLWVTSGHPAGAPSYAELAPEVRERLALQAQSQAVAELKRRLAAKVGVVSQPAPLSDLPARLAGPPGIVAGVPAAPHDPSAPFVAVEPDDA